MLQIEDLALVDDGVDWAKPMPSGDEFVLQARDIRRERTGVHALVMITFKGTLLAHDTFNITRSEQRRKLVRDAQKLMGDDLKASYDADFMAHDLDMLCLYLAQDWEASRVEIKRFDANVIYLPVPRRLDPYILQDAGTVFFGPEGGLKSYLVQIMACFIACGLTDIWQLIQGHVLYINLERSEASFGRREMMIRQALGIGGDSGVDYIHARGYSFSYVKRKAREYVRAHPGCVVILDSISRAAEGKLIDDVTANKFINDMNGLETTWVATGHVPKGGDALFGSMHFRAGQDIGVKVIPGQQGTTRGLCLKLDKANDLAFPEPEYLALDFAPDGSGLIGIRRTVKDEFPDIDLNDKASDLDRLVDYVDANGDAATTSAAKALSMDAAKVSRLFKKSGRFTQSRRIGHQVLYALKDEFDDSEQSS